MKEPRHDDERLAALLEGRLEGPERDELLAYLAAADEDFHVFAKTAAALREMEEEEPAQAADAGVRADPPPRPEVVPPSVREPAARWPRRRAPRWIAIPAVLVGLVVLGTLVWRGQASAPGPLQVAALVDPPRGGFPDQWEWERLETRGTGSATALTPADAAWAGVLLVDLAVAIQAGDSADIYRFATELDDIGLGGEALKEIVARAGAPAASLQPLLERATERLEDLFESDDHLRLGAWTEAARFAADGRNESFFRSRDTRRMLRRAGRLADTDASAQAALRDVRAATEADGAPDWESLKASVENLQAAITA